jgi:hypothetical protein
MHFLPLTRWRDHYTVSQYRWRRSGALSGAGQLKGTVQRDFLTPVFFTKRIILVSIDIPKSDLEICRTLVELFVLELSKNRLLAVNDRGESKTEP